MTAHAYFDRMMPRLSTLGESQLAAIQQAGQVAADAVAGGGRIWVAKTTHCLHDEVTYRAGGFMAIHPLEDPVTIEAGDAVVIGTNAGTTELTVETALIAHARGAKVIALTQMPYETDPNVPAEHPSGTKLHEHADVLVDLGGQTGDGELTMGNGFLIIPGSGVAAMLALWMILPEAVDRLEAVGKTPSMWQSMQMPGATAGNLARLGAYRRTHIGYATGSES